MVVGVPQGPRAEPRLDISSWAEIRTSSDLASPALVRGTRLDIHVQGKADLLGRPAFTALESTQSPHSIAFQVATVRYSVEKKHAVTCDDAQGPWSEEGRVILCKQGVAGSSPVVSTLTGWSGRFDELNNSSEPAGVPTMCPKNRATGASSTAFAGTGGSCPKRSR